MGTYQSNAQTNGSVGMGTTAPNPNAILDLVSDKQGFLVPRLNAKQRSTMGNSLQSSPDPSINNGLLIFDQIENQFYYWSDKQWVKLNDKAITLGGSTWRSGTSIPPNIVGKDGDFYLNINKGDVYEKSAGVYSLLFNIIGPAGATGAVGSTGPAGAAGLQGVKGDKGYPGVAGATGPAGAMGLDGANGKTILNGTTNPAAGTGVNGDFYLNTITSGLFGPKTNAGWGSSTSLIGSTSGAAGGDLAGNYPNPTIAINSVSTTKVVDAAITTNKLANGAVDLAGNKVTGTLPVAAGGTGTTALNGVLFGNGTGAFTGLSATAADQYLRRNTANTAYEFGTLPPGTLPTGELPLTFSTGLTRTSNTISAQTTTALWNANQLQGRNVATTAPTNGYALKWNNTASQWEPQVDVTSISGATGALTFKSTSGLSVSGPVMNATAAGDVTGDLGANTVVKIQNVAVANTVPTANQILQYNTTNARWEPTTVAGVTNSVKYFSLDPTAFVGTGKNAGKVYYYGQDADFVATSDKDQTGIGASVVLPHGATIQKIIFYYFDSENGGGNADMNFYLKRKDRASATATNLATANSSGAGGAGNQSLAVNSIVDNSLYTYKVIVYMNDYGNDVADVTKVKHRLYSVIIEYLP